MNEQKQTSELATVTPIFPGAEEAAPIVQPNAAPVEVGTTVDLAQRDAVADQLGKESVWLANAQPGEPAVTAPAAVMSGEQLRADQDLRERIANAD